MLHGHTGRIRLYHGGYGNGSFYRVQELRKIAQTHPNFSYVPCVSEEAAIYGNVQGMVLDAALRDNADLSGWRIFLCGNPDMVTAARREVYLAGAAISDIFADPF